MGRCVCVRVDDVLFMTGFVCWVYPKNATRKRQVPAGPTKTQGNIPLRAAQRGGHRGAAVDGAATTTALLYSTY